MTNEQLKSPMFFFYSISDRVRVWLTHNYAGVSVPPNTKVILDQTYASNHTQCTYGS